jgi:hypothetical protein
LVELSIKIDLARIRVKIGAIYSFFRWIGNAETLRSHCQSLSRQLGAGRFVARALAVAAKSRSGCSSNDEKAAADRNERSSIERGGLVKSQAVFVLSFSFCLLAAALRATPANADWMAEYTAPTGATVNSSLFSFTGSTGLWAANEITLSGTHLFIANTLSGTIGEYNTTGTTVNASLITGLGGFGSGPIAVGVSGSDLFVLRVTGTIGEYTTSGGTVNASLITGVGEGFAISGSDIFVTSGNKIAEYTTGGTLVNSSLITGLNSPFGIAASGSDLFIANYQGETISEYTTSGSLVSSSLIGHIDDPIAITVSGSDMFIIYDGGATIGEWTTAGVPVNPTLYTAGSGVIWSDGIAVSGSTVFASQYEVVGPEPSTFVLFAFGAAALVVCGLRKRRAAGEAIEPSSFGSA